MNKEAESTVKKSSFGSSLLFSLGFFVTYLIILFLVLIVFFHI